MWADRVAIDVMHETRPYDVETHTTYLRWYVPRSRSNLTGPAPQRPTEVAHDTVVRAGPDLHRAARQDETYDRLRRISNEAADGLRRGRTNTTSQFLGVLRTIYDDARAAMRTIICSRHSDITALRGGHRGQPPPPPPSAPPSTPPSARPSHSGSRRSYGRSSSTRLGQAHLRGDNTLLQPSSSRRETRDWTSSPGPPATLTCPSAGTRRCPRSHMAFSQTSMRATRGSGKRTDQALCTISAPIAPKHHRPHSHIHRSGVTNLDSKAKDRRPHL